MARIASIVSLITAATALLLLPAPLTAQKEKPAPSAQKPEPAEWLVKGARWLGQGPGKGYDLIITERDGNNFTAELLLNGRHFRNVAGSVSGDKIKWYGAMGEKNLGYYNRGAINGKRIEVEYFKTDFSTDTNAHGKLVLEYEPAKGTATAKPVVAEKPVTAPVSPFQSKSVWTDDTGSKTLSVTELDGATFRGRFTIGTNYVRDVTGTFKDGKVSWLAKDVRAIKGGAGHDNHGTLSTDKLGGSKIDFVSNAPATFTLYLKSKPFVADIEPKPPIASPPVGVPPKPADVKLPASVPVSSPPAADPGIAKPNLELPPADAKDANAAWRQLAALASFSWGGEKRQVLLELYLPYRSNHAAPPSDQVQKLLAEYEALADTPHPYVKRATAQALALCRARLRLALANDTLGNTPTSSIRSFQQNVLLPSVQYQLLREADRANWQESLERQYPGYRVIVNDAPMSTESRQKLNEFVKGAGGIREDIQKRAVVSGLLAYADMAQVDRTVAFWQTWLMPLVKRGSGPASDKPLVEISGDWKKVVAGKIRFEHLNVFHVHNVAGRDLTNVVVALLAENEWGEQAAHYYYIPQLDRADVDFLMPHERWKKRRLPFTNSLALTCSVWADQGSYTSQIKLISPTPNPIPEVTRKNYLEYDREYQSKGEALGTVVQNMYPVPIDPAGHLRRLRDAAAPGTSYIFNVPGEGKTARTLILSFVHFAEGPGAIEAKVIDPKSGKPFHENTPVWKGQLADLPSGKAITFGTPADWQKSGWAFALSPDDSVAIFCPASGATERAFPLKLISPFATKSP